MKADAVFLRLCAPTVRSSAGAAAELAVGSCGEGCVLQGAMDALRAGKRGALEQRRKNVTIRNVPVGCGRF